MSTILFLLSVAYAADPEPATIPEVQATETVSPGTPMELPAVPAARRQCITRLMVVSEVIGGTGLAMIGGAIVDSQHDGEFVAPLAVVGGSLSLGGITMLFNLRPALKGLPSATAQNC